MNRSPAAPSPRTRRSDRDVLRQVVLLDEGVRPHLLQQLFLSDQAAVPRHEDQQRVEGFRSEGHRLLVLQQDLVDRVEAELTENETQPR